MDLTSLRVKALIYPHGEYHLGKAMKVEDEGSFYRVDGTHIFDKLKILSIEETDRRVTIEMKVQNVVLEVEK